MSEDLVALGESDVDFAIEGRTDGDIGEELSHSLWLKGYCVLNLGLGEDKRVEALDDLHSILGDRFEPPPPQLIEGLLGDQGSAEMALLDHPDSDCYEGGEALKDLAKDLAYMASHTGTFFQSLDLDYTPKMSVPMAIRGGEVTRGDSLELTEGMCIDWLNLLKEAKLMLLYFMGPDEGSLELQPLDGESDEVTIVTRPDMLVILRCDALSHRHVSARSDYVICSWLTTPRPTIPRGWQNTSEADKRLPGVKELSEWVEDRIKELARLDADKALPEDVPRHWQRMLHSEYFTSSCLPVAIKGMATHGPSTNDCHTMARILTQGVDFVGEVPHIRWDHSVYYDSDPQSYLSANLWTNGVYKVSVKHFQHIEGIELFDNKFFQISASEATGMEPQQHHILETSYEALFMAGYNKKSLMQKYIAVISSSTHPEAAYIDYCTGAGAGNQSQAIISNRTSFVLGMMGPSTPIDAEQCGAHMALLVGASAVSPNHQHRLKTDGLSEASITGGVYLALTPFLWPRFNVLMNPNGRCFTFDASANGFVKGEGCTSFTQAPYMERVDGKWVKPEQRVLGTMVGWRASSNGRTAGLTAPHGPGLMDAIAGAVEATGISGLDIDAVECHGVGGLLDDSIEVTATASLLRSVSGSADEPLVLGAVKTSVSNQSDTVGMTAFLKVLTCIMYANNIPNLHLKQMNPHIEFEDPAAFANVECVAYRDKGVFHGLSGRGIGGTNAHLIQWYKPDPNLVWYEMREAEKEPFAFWPAGGGVLDRGSTASEGYYIVGSWNDWQDPEEMERVDDGVYTYTVTLGPNVFETFQVWLDGESERALHPTKRNAASASAVAGPSDSAVVRGQDWMIDGRVAKYSRPQQLSLPSDDSAVVEVSGRDTGRPGDRYQVKLQIAGKYRAVTWQKVHRVADESETRRAFLHGCYYVAGAWSQWQLQEMARADYESGVHTLDVGPFVTGGRYDFQLIRNKDWSQVFHPDDGAIATDSWDEAEVAGPDDGGHNKNWCIKASKGDVFRIEFHRTLDGGFESRRIAFRRLL